ncbi:MAG: YqaA family protein [Alphaproteobacteria bacterium]
MILKQSIRYLYLKTLRASKKPQAIWLLLLIAFVESIFLPLPSMSIFIIVALAQHRNALLIAIMTAIASCAGSLIGYGIGAFFWENFSPMILSNDKLAQSFTYFQELYDKYDVFAVIIAAITPIPFKLAAIGSGILGMNFILFVITAFIGRFIYFFTPALLIFFMGHRAKYFLEKYLHIVFISILAIAIIFLIIMRLT